MSAATRKTRFPGKAPPNEHRGTKRRRETWATTRRSALERLKPAEAKVALRRLLALRPALGAEAEKIARDLVSDVSSEALADVPSNLLCSTWRRMPNLDGRRRTSPRGRASDLGGSRRARPLGPPGRDSCLMDDPRERPVERSASRCSPEKYATVRPGRTDRRSSPSSTLPRSPSRTSPSRPRTRRLPRWPGAASASRRSSRHGCRST